MSIWKSHLHLSFLVLVIIYVLDYSHPGGSFKRNRRFWVGSQEEIIQSTEEGHYV